MLILLLFAFISGLITIAAPCIWPILPIILSSTTTGGHRKPLGITLGIVTSFAFFTLALSYIISIIPFDANILRFIAVIIISFLGLTLLIPQLNQLLEGYVSQMSSRFAAKDTTNSGFKSGYITGFALGIVWTPCAGPILGTIATLAGTQQVSFQIILVTLAYVSGVAIPLFILLTLGQKLFAKTRALNKYTGQIQQVFGLIMIVSALAIATNYHIYLQAKLLDLFPSYSSFINTFEGNETVKKQLDTIKGSPSALPQYANAPEFEGIEKWLNTEKPLTMKELKGKVVLIDFWTYTCINCVRTLPYVTSWYEKYKDDGFVVIGVHTPEFAFEKKTANVQSALEQYNITYPVAQDNEYGTWKAYNNQYWPAHYLIDANGVVRYTHFGEGKYEETETAIQTLLKEAGKQVTAETLTLEEQTPRGAQTPETYVGLARLEYATNSINKTGVQSLIRTDEVPNNSFSFSGQWDIQQEYSKSVKDSRLLLHFNARKVFLVMEPTQGVGTATLKLYGLKVASTLAGKDTKNSMVEVSSSRMYELIDMGEDAGEHILEIDFSPNIAVYAFTFGS